MAPADAGPVVVDDDVLRRHPLPAVDGQESKDGRGSVLIVGGARETPGGVALAGTAAFRAGAGRVTLATVASRCAALAVAMPECRVIELPETADGSIAPAAAEALRSAVQQHDALLVGTGATDRATTTALVGGLLAYRPTAVVLDAAALHDLEAQHPLLRAVAPQCVLIPNPHETDALLDHDGDAADDPHRALVSAVARFGCTVAVRGPDTWVMEPDGMAFVERSGSIALATAGSGDVVAGAVAGLLARGARPLVAVLWAVRAHALAGASVAEHDRAVGIMAHDVADALAPVFADLAVRTGALTPRP